MKMSGLGGRLAAPVKQPAKAKLLVALPPASHVPVADADNLRRLPPSDLLRLWLAQILPSLSLPAHRGLRVGDDVVHAPPLTACQADRHLLTHPDISCANDIPKKSPKNT